MKVEVLLFAAAREKAGTDRMTVELPAGATVESLWWHLGEGRSELAAVLTTCRAAVDESFAPASTILRDGSVVAVLPPVSGG